MASANFSKIKTAQETKAKIRHDDKEQRLKTEHTNPHIDKSMTSKNLSFYGRSYADVCSRYDSIISDCDSKPNANKRSDRVTNVCVEIPVPDNLKPQDEERFFRCAGVELCKFYGDEALLEGYFHVDEKHEYFDAQEKRFRVSRNHATFRFVPLVNGSLNAREFTSRKNLIGVNNLLEEMCEREFKIPFNNGKGKRGRTVEELKNESTAAVKKINSVLVQREKRLDEREGALNEREDTLDVKEALYRQTIDEEAKRALNVSQRALKAELQRENETYIANWTKKAEIEKREWMKTYDDRVAKAMKANTSNPDRRLPNLPSDFTF